MARLNEKVVINEIVEKAGVSAVNAQNIVSVFRGLWKTDPVEVVHLLVNKPVVATTKTVTAKRRVTKKVVKKVAKKVAKKVKAKVNKKNVNKVKKNKKSKKGKGVSLKKNVNLADV